MNNFIKNGIESFSYKISSKIDMQCTGAVLTAFIITRVMVCIIVLFSMIQLPVLSGEGLWRLDTQNLIQDGLTRWDSGWYMNIAQNGYSSSTVAFFPLYPILIRALTRITGSTSISGLLIANLSFFVALFYLYAITKQDYDDNTAGRAVFYIAAAPSAFFFSTVYTESLFLLFVTAGFYYARKSKWLFACLAGVLASATRINGVLVGAFILFEAFWQKGIRFFPKPWSARSQIDLLRKDIGILPQAKKGILAAILSLLGLAAYMAYLYREFGDPLAFLHVQENWGRSVGFDWLLRVLQDHSQKLDILFTIIFIPIVIITFFKFRPSYGLFTLLSFMIPLVSGSLLSMRRFVIVIVPCYILLALWGKKQWVDRLIIGISLPMQAYFVVLFSHWYFAG